MSDHHFGWFKPADYQGFFQLSDWAEMISRRNEWQTILPTYHATKAERWSALPYDLAHLKGHVKLWDDPPWNHADIEEDTKRFWDDYVADVLPCNLGAPRPKWYPTTSIRVPAITDITHCFKEIGDFEIEATGAHVLMVDPRATDAVLEQCFVKWLVEHRKRSPLPVKRRGRSSTNLEVTNSHLSSWRQYNVLAMLDLDFCAQVFGIRRVSHETLGRDFLECPSKVDPKEWGRVARAKAEEAMECLSLLEAQIQQSGPK